MLRSLPIFNEVLETRPIGGSAATIFHYAIAITPSASDH
jgi:hypothetical protein